MKICNIIENEEGTLLTVESIIMHLVEDMDVIRGFGFDTYRLRFKDGVPVVETPALTPDNEKAMLEVLPKEDGERSHWKRNVVNRRKHIEEMDALLRKGDRV